MMAANARTDMRGKKQDASLASQICLMLVAFHNANKQGAKIG